MMLKSGLEKTSWQKVGPWYKNLVGDRGHYYHQRVIMPNILRLMDLRSGLSILDLGCGQGVLARYIAKNVNYIGVDLARNLIDEAKRNNANPRHSYFVADICGDLKIREKFEWVTFVLTVQNIKHPYRAVKNAYLALKTGGKLLMVINHPAFRIPKHSDWMVKDNKQYRIVDNYMTPLEIPIESSPFDKRNNLVTWSYHYPLSAYSEMLFDNGFVIEKIEEWMSDKKSTGRMARIEDEARKEFPLFMVIVAKKGEK